MLRISLLKPFFLGGGDFLNFFKFNFSFLFIHFWIFRFCIIFEVFFGFYGFFSKLLRLLLNVTKVTTGHQKLPKMG